MRMRDNKYLQFFLVAFGGLSILIGSYLSGYVTSDKGLFPSTHIENVKWRLKEFVNSDSSKGPVLERLETALINLKVVKIKVPVDYQGDGGALTSAGDQILLMDRMGQIYVLKDAVLQRLSIEPPNNHFVEYQTASRSEKYKDFNHNLDVFRFNDLLYLSTQGEHSLVTSYTEWLPEKECFGSSISQLKLTGENVPLADIRKGASDWELVFRTEPCLPLKESMRALEGHMAGGRLADARDGKIYMASGDYHWDGVYAPKALAQDSTNDYGKVLEIELSTKESRHISKGQRNIQGIIVDRAGRLWTTEHGPRGGDELNLVTEGSNYGWPQATLGTRYNRLPWASARQYGRHDDFTGPVYAWLPSVGLSNLIQVDGFDPSWDGDLLVATLRGQSLFRLRVIDKSIRFVEPITIGERIRYVHQHTDGRILLWTDHENLIILSKDDSTPTAVYLENALNDMDFDAQRKRKVADAISGCSECHSFDYGIGQGAPSLSGIFGKPIARANFQYSSSLANLDSVWNESTLTDYLNAPGEFAPGTTMPNPNLGIETVEDLISILKALGAAE